MPDQKKAAIVYGAYINPDADWRSLIAAQLNDLSNFGVLNQCDLYVVVTNPTRAEGVRSLFNDLRLPTKLLEIYADNRFEYPAISRVWNLATNSAHYEYVGYLHSKGMSYAKSERNRLELILTRHTFSSWARVFQLFENVPSIEKAGLFPAHDGDRTGWIWFNFWWARASYIRNLPKPLVSPDRFYYEGWLSLQSQTPNSTYSLLSNDFATYAWDETGAHFRDLRWKLRYGYFYNVRKLVQYLRDTGAAGKASTQAPELHPDQRQSHSMPQATSDH